MMLNNRYRFALCGAVLAMCLSLGVRAQERAAVILEDGERLSGTLLPGEDARARNSRSRSELILATDEAGSSGSRWTSWR